MDYLKLFQTHQEYTEYLVSSEYLRPNVSHCIQENEVHYTVPIDWSKEYFTIESLEDNNTIYFKANNTAITKTISASTDNGETWTEYTTSTGGSGTTLATLNKGDKLLIKGQNESYGSNYINYNQFKTTGQFEVKGNIMSLINGDSFVNSDELTMNFAFLALFISCVGLISAENLILPATTLSQCCYHSMFNGCTNLVKAPELPATEITYRCYRLMFYECESLIKAPELPATTLAEGCYDNMFYHCTSLTTAPELPATTLADSCYIGMFLGCTSLTTAPELPAETLVSKCYWSMLQGCTSLTTAPELPATTLVSGCYRHMFSGCTNLNYIKCVATDISAASATTNWTVAVAENGTFVKSANMSSWTTGVDGIPNGWTIQDVS